PPPPAWGAHPSILFSFGGAVDGGHFSWIERVKTASPGGGTMTVLTPAEGSRVGGRAGASLAVVRQYLHGGAFTVEAALGYKRAWDESAPSVRWCSPAGNGQRPNSTLTDPAEICTEGRLDAPLGTHEVLAALL